MSLYGYKEREVLKFIDFLRENKNKKNLSSLFVDYARQNGKASGSVRNMYYAICKEAQNNEDFANEHLGELTLKVSRAVKFKEIEERHLIKKILLGKLNGNSARKTILEMSLGDEKVALRYQNKYRNTLRQNPNLIEEIKQEIERETGKSFPKDDKRSGEFFRLEEAINNLVERIGSKTKQENERLKMELFALKKENGRLRLLLEENKAKNRAR